MNSPVYNFDEMMDFIRTSKNVWELTVIGLVLEDNKHEYSIFDFRLLNCAIGVMQDIFSAQPIPKFPKSRH